MSITVLHTTDLHGHFFPTTDYDGRPDMGGLLRCATRIRELRETAPNVLLVDCGDLYQGAAESFLTDGRLMVQALDELKYDAWIIGNHEFDWGLGTMTALIESSATPMLSANMVSLPGRAHPFPRIRPYRIVEVDGVRVAIVGLITPAVPTWSTPDLIGDARFERSIEALRRIMPLVRTEEPDVLLLATHQGYKLQGDDHANEINAIARQFPEFDAIIGGHSHQPVPEAWIDGRMLYTQAGYHGIWLGQLDLVYDTVTRRVVHKSARLHEMGPDVMPDAALSARFEKDLNRAQDYLARRIGRAEDRFTWTPDEFGVSPVQRLLARSLSEASEAPLVLHGVLDEIDLDPGDITMADLWRIVPYENRVAVLQVTPAELIEILEENAVQRRAHAFMGLYGARYRWETDASGGRRPAGLVLADGSAPHPRQRLRLAVNSYVLASGGGRYPTLRAISERPETRTRILDIDTRTAVLEYIRRNQPLRVVDVMGAK